MVAMLEGARSAKAITALAAPALRGRRRERYIKLVERTLESLESRGLIRREGS